MIKCYKMLLMKNAGTATMKQLSLENLMALNDTVVKTVRKLNYGTTSVLPVSQTSIRR